VVSWIQDPIARQQRTLAWSLLHPLPNAYWGGMDMPERPNAEPVLVLQTAQDAVLDYLRHQILSRQLLPGARLVQSELAERLGVSRTPIREALQRLAHEGLVTLSSYRSASVARFSASDLEEIYAVRAALESHATYLAVQNNTDGTLERLKWLLSEMARAFEQGDLENLLTVHHQFHASIYAAARKPRLYELILQYLELANLYQRMALSMGRGAQDPVVEHQELLHAMQRRDAEGAARLMREHLDLTALELLKLFRDQEAVGGAAQS
jgi:DNA-binding GntR family transcriptional regulator